MHQHRVVLGSALGLGVTLTLSAWSWGGMKTDISGGAIEMSYGKPIQVGDGTVRTYVARDGDRPTEVGIALSSGVLEGLPVDGAPGGVIMPDGHSGFEWELEMPGDNPTPYQFALFGWNPAGHEPDGTYTIPHFDFHFYTVPGDVRHGMDPTDPQFVSKGLKAPESIYTPSGYTPLEDALVPFMGNHWVDPNAPELRHHGRQPFTHTFLFGSWDGRVIFAEPMITKAFLEARQEVRLPLAMAERYDPQGYYPASYEIRWLETESEYRIALTDLAWRN